MIRTLVTIFCIVGVTYSTPRGEAVTDILQTILNKYDSRVRPNYGEKPTDVMTTAYIIRAINFNERDGLISLEAYYRETWNDPRLKYQRTSSRPEKVTGGAELHHKIWAPDTFVANGETRNTGMHMFYRITATGDIMKSTKTIFEIQCPENFGNFPMDTQICQIETESYGQSAIDIVYHFKKEGAVGVAPSVDFGNLRLIGTKERMDSIQLTTGNYSRLAIELHLVRNPGPYIKYFYAPAILLFLVSWAVFWLPSSSVLLRGVLGFMSLKMSMGLMKKGSQDISPHIGYMTRLDEYMVTCSVLALIALFESITVYSLYRNRPGAGNLKNSDDEDAEIAVDVSQPKEQMEMKSENGGLKSIGSYLDRGTKYALNIRHHRRGHEKVDLFFRIIYPIFFILFNIIYWAICYRTQNEQIAQMNNTV